MKRKGPRTEPFCLDPVSGGDLIGRAAEKDRMRAELAGNPGLILLHGDRGIGKTSLLRCLPELNTGHEFPVEYDAGKNLGFWGGIGEPLEKHVGISRDKMSFNFGITPPVTSAQMPHFSIGPNIQHTLPPGEQARYGELCQKLKKLRRPVCVRIRDAYKLPEADQRWLLQLPSDTGKVYVVLEAPDTYVERLIAEVLREARRVFVGPLDRDAMLQVVARGGNWLTEANVDQVIASAAGNPYYLQSVCYVLWHRWTAGDNASVERTLQNLRADTDISERLGIVHREVLDSIGPGTDLFLIVQAAAFAPVEFNEMVLRRLSGLDGTRFARALRQVRLRGILSPETRNSDRLRFYHPFFRDYVREQAPMDERELNGRRAKLVGEVRDSQTVQLMLSAHIDDSDLLMKLADNVSDAIALNEVARRLWVTGRLDDAARLLERLRGLSHGNRRNEASAIGNMGIIYHAKGEPDRALQYYEEALAIQRGTGYQQGVTSQLCNIGLIYSDKGEPDKALNYYEEALAIAREIGYQQGLADALGNIGNIYRAKGERDKALKYHEEALTIDRRIGYQQGVASDLANIGAIYYDRGELDKALLNYNEALGTGRSMRWRECEAKSLGSIGLILSDMGKYEQGVAKLVEALGIFFAIGVAAGTRQVLTGLVRCEDELGRKRMEGLFKEAGLDDGAIADLLKRIDQRRQEMGKPES